MLKIYHYYELQSKNLPQINIPNESPLKIHLTNEVLF